jgi:hypothetical protein
MHVKANKLAAAAVVARKHAVRQEHAMTGTPGNKLVPSSIGSYLPIGPEIHKLSTDQEAEVPYPRVQEQDLFRV